MRAQTEDRQLTGSRTFSCRVPGKFDSVAEYLECPDHSSSTSSLRLFRYCWTSLLVAHALMQNYPDKLTQAMGDCPNGLVVAKAQHKTAVQDFEDTTFLFDGSIGTLIEDAAHVTVALRRACAAIHACALFLSRTCPNPGDKFFG